MSLPKDVLIEIFKLIPSTMFCALATCCKDFSKILEHESLWKPICDVKSIQVTDGSTHFETAKKKMTPWWTWNEELLVKQGPTGWYAYYLTNEPLTPKRNEFSIIVDYEYPLDHFELGIYERSTTVSVVGFTWSKAVIYLKNTVRCGSETRQIRQIKPLDVVTFSIDFSTKILSVYIQHKLEMEIDVSGWKAYYPAAAFNKDIQMKFYYYK